ncbi:NUDIX hydrolase [Lentzea alba]|uniref:NUDIX hydrolase n=1 Tax=Lentzea alba TaxID=2714351 RepID=UPI0039BF5ECE
MVVRDGTVLLLKNERDEWELPGGRIEPGESPEECVAREVAEETQWQVTAGPVLDAWMYYIDVAAKNVFIVTCGCHPHGDSELVLSHEHKEIGLFAEGEVPGLDMPEGYKRSISAWFERLRADAVRPVSHRSRRQRTEFALLALARASTATSPETGTSS